MDWNREENAVTRRGLLMRLSAFTLAWLGSRGTARARRGADAWDPVMEVVIDFEIAQAEGFRSHRPYVAVWVEGKDGRAVRTLSLWVENSRRGSRWIPDLRRWYRDAYDEQAAGGPDLVATVSSATRMPGRYSLVWDGKDDRGRLVPKGSYVVNLESAREHGPYGLLQQQVTIGPKAFKVDVAAGNADLKGVTVEYRKRQQG